MIGRSGERGSGISVLAARHDDDDECDSKKTNNNNTYYITEQLYLLIDGTLKGTTILGQSAPWINGNEGLQHIHKISRTGVSPSD